MRDQGAKYLSMTTASTIARQDRQWRSAGSVVAKATKETGGLCHFGGQRSLSSAMFAKRQSGLHLRPYIVAETNNLPGMMGWPEL